MNDYKTILKERLEVLPQSLRGFVLKENWRREAEQIGQQFNLDEEKYASFENEVFLVLLCFEPRQDFKENIKRELGLDDNTANQINEKVRQQVFSPIDGQLARIEKQINANNQQNSQPPKPQNHIGNSFEQAIVNQARAMQPARNATHSVAGGPARETPSNLPTEEKPREVHDYKSGEDPYREPPE